MSSSVTMPPSVTVSPNITPVPQKPLRLKGLLLPAAHTWPEKASLAPSRTAAL